jgi:hypothetical protein
MKLPSARTAATLAQTAQLIALGVFAYTALSAIHDRDEWHKLADRAVRQATESTALARQSFCNECTLQRDLWNALGQNSKANSMSCYFARLDIYGFRAVDSCDGGWAPR